MHTQVLYDFIYECMCIFKIVYRGSHIEFDKSKNIKVKMQVCSNVLNIHNFEYLLLTQSVDSY